MFAELSGMKIKNKNLIAFLVIVMLNIPGFLIRIFTIYHTEYVYELGDFVKLSYSFTLVELLLCICGMFLHYYKKIDTVNVYPILIVIFFRDLFYYLSGSKSPFRFNSWEMYLPPIIGMASCTIAVYYLKNKDYINMFLDWLIIVNLLYQLMFLIAGKTSDGGRVASINQGIGSVGYMCALHVLYSLLTRAKNKNLFFIISLSLISIILSGSRFSLLIIIVGVIAFGIYIIKNTSRRDKKLFFFFSIGSLFIVFPILTVTGFFEKYEIISRMSNVFQGRIIDNILTDQSVKERIKSIKIGFEILHDYPFGISNSFIDLQGKTIEHGFYAFPHSTFLAYYLMWGPVFLICIFWIIKRIFLALRLREKGICYFLLLYLIILSIYGGIEVAPKVYTYVFCMLSSINVELKNNFLLKSYNKDF